MGTYKELVLNKKGQNKDEDEDEETDFYYNRDFQSKSKVYTNHKLNIHHNDYNYSYTFFIKINSLEYKYNKNKEIFSKGTSVYKYNVSDEDCEDDTGCTDNGELINSSHNPRVFIAKQTNDIVIEIQTYKKKERCIIDNIPLQAWVAIGIVVHNKRVDIYVNGTLYKSCVLNDLPVPCEHKIRYGNNGGFDGSLNKLVYYFRALSSLEILDLFNKNKGALKNSIDVKTQSMEIMKIKTLKKDIESCYS